MSLRDWYEKASSEKTGIRHLTEEQANAYLDLLAVPNQPGMKLLEVGFGDGSFLQQAMKRVDCVGIYTDDAHYKAAAQRLGETAGTGVLVECALEDMRFYPEKFHFIFMIGQAPNDKEAQVIQVLLHRYGKYCIVDANGTVVTGVKEPI